MEKAAQAFRTISEVAEDLDVPKHVLRFWEGKFPHIKPMKRGGGRRYYRPDDVELLRGIRRLLYEEGYTIKGVQKVIRESGIDYVKAFWQQPEKGKSRGTAVSAEAPAAAKPVGRRGRTKPEGAEAEPISAGQAVILREVVAELEACRNLLTQLIGR